MSNLQTIEKIKYFLPAAAIFPLLFSLLLSGCPGDDDDDNGDSGGMCFYVCEGGGAYQDGCWHHDDEDSCYDTVEQDCEDRGMEVVELEFEEGCSMCDECNPDWYPAE